MVTTRQRGHSAGFTLVELLVTIGVISVLIAIAIPAFRGVKIQSQQTVALSDLRQIGLSITMYTDDSFGYFPFCEPGTMHLIGPPHDPFGTIFVGDEDPWSLSYLWPSRMHRIAPWDDHYSTWIGVGRRHGSRPWLREEGEGRHWLRPSYTMSNAFVATPGTWGESGVARIQAARPTQVRSPSSKVIFFDGGRPYLRGDDSIERPRGVLMVDGSAAMISDDDAAEPVMNRITQTTPRRYHDTPGGIYGRDF